MSTDDISAAVTRLYVAAFQRAPELEGFNYWVGQAKALGLNSVLNQIFTLPIVQAIYPTASSSADFVTAIYQNVFNKLPDTDGLNYWVGELNSTGRGQLVYNMITAGLNTPLGTVGRDIIVDRVDHGLSAVSLQAQKNVSLAPATLLSSFKTITADHGTVDAAASSTLSSILASSPAAKSLVESFTTLTSYARVLVHAGTHENIAVTATYKNLDSGFTYGVAIQRFTDNFTEQTSDFLPTTSGSVLTASVSKSGLIGVLGGDNKFYAFTEGADTYSIASVKSVGSATDHLLATDFNANGNFLVVGDENSYANGRDAYIAILDKAGNVLNQVRYENTSGISSNFSFGTVQGLADGDILVGTNTYAPTYYLLNSNLDIKESFTFKASSGPIKKLLSYANGTSIALTSNGNIVYFDKNFVVTGTAGLKFVGDGAAYRSFTDIAEFNGHLYALTSTASSYCVLAEFNGTAIGSTLVDTKVITDRNGSITSFNHLDVDNGLAYLTNSSSGTTMAIVSSGAVTPNLVGEHRINNLTTTSGSLVSGAVIGSYDFTATGSTNVQTGAGSIVAHNDITLIGVPIIATALHFTGAALPTHDSMGTLL